MNVLCLSITSYNAASLSIVNMFCPFHCKTWPKCIFLNLIYNFCLVFAPQYICCFYTINTLYYMLLLPITEIIFGMQFLSYLAIAHFKFSVEYHICQIRLAKKSAPYLSRILKNSLPSKYHSHLLVEKHVLQFFSWLKI